MYRFERMKMRNDYLTDYYQQMTHIVKMKNPSLLLILDNKEKKIVFK